MLRNVPLDRDRSESDATETSNGCSRRSVLRTAGGTALAGTVVSAISGIGSATGPTEKWRFETGSGIGSSPTIVDGVVYVGSGDGHLYAIDQSGAELWSVDLGTTIGDSPSVIDGTVYIAADDLYAFDAETGEKQWQYSHFARHVTRQTVAGGVAFLTSGADAIAVDIATGEELWDFLDPSGASVTSSPLVVDGSVYVGLGAASIFQLDATDGSIQNWHHAETGGHVNTSPTTDGDRIMFGTDNNYHYNIELDATELGRARELGGLPSSPTIHNGVVYFGISTGFSGLVNGYRYDDSVTTLDRAIDQSIFMTSPTIADGVLYVGSEGFDSYLWAIDIDSGEPIWQFETEGWIRSSPTVANGTVYVGSNDGNLYAIDAVGSGSSEDSRVNNGTLGHHDTWAETSPTVTIGTISAGDDDDTVDGDDSADSDDADSVGDVQTDDGTADDSVSFDDDEPVQSDDADTDGIPGPGIVGTLTAVGGAGYLLNRRFNRRLK